MGGWEPELLREVERYQLDIVRFTSTHSPVHALNLNPSRGFGLNDLVAHSCSWP